MLNLDHYLTIDEKTCKAANLTDRFNDIDLGRIAEHVWQSYDSDLDSRSDWERRSAAGMDLAMQVVQDKSFPWPNCANVAFPLVTIAALQFHARAYPSIISGTEVVKCRTTNFEPTPEELAQADRTSRYMSRQVLEEDTAWEEGHDRLLLNYSIVGCAFIKSYYSAGEMHNVSELVLAQDLVVDYYAKSIETARTKTHVSSLTRNALLSGIRLDTPIYRDVSEMPWFLDGGTPNLDKNNTDDNRTGKTEPQSSRRTPFTALEQHCWIDLDNDGFEEPYIATILEGSKTLIRLIARWESEDDVKRNLRKQIIDIRATEYFTKYGFIPAPDGSIYDMGFGVLLGPLNESVSSLINQLLDAGTMSNGAGGFLGRGAKIRGGVYTFAPFEWKRVDSTGEDLAKSIYPLPVREPSAVLFNLLGLLIDYTNRISGATETLVGESPGQNTPAETSRSMVEQGMKVYSAIFKRCWRAMKEEFRKLYLLNAAYSPLRYREMFLGDPNTICPAADPNIVSDSERFMKASAIATRAQTVPGYNPVAVEENFLRALKVDNPKQFYVGVQPGSQPDDPKIAVQKLKMQQAAAELQWEQQKFVAELLEERQRYQLEARLIQAQIVELLAKAANESDNLEIVKMQTLLAVHKQRDEALRGRVDHLLKIMELESEPERKRVNSGEVRRLVGASGDGGAQPLPPQPATGDPATMVAG